MTLREIIKNLPGEALDYEIIIVNKHDPNIDPLPIFSVLINKRGNTLIIEHE